MITEKKLFTIIVIIFPVLFLTVNILSLFKLIPHKSAYSYNLSFCYTSLNFIGAVISIKLGWGKKIKSLINNYLIGVGIRLPLILGLFVVSIKFLEINRIIFIFSFLILYIFFLITEIVFLLIIQRS